MVKLISLVALTGIGVLLLPMVMSFPVTGPSRVDANSWKVVDQGSIEVWKNYPGKVHARQVRNIVSRMNGAATLVDVIADGARVEKGDLIARFDAAELEQEVIRLEREHRLVQIELDSLTKAQIPLEMAELEGKLKELSGRLEYERLYLRDSESLLADNLLSAQEVEKQKSTVRQLEAEYGNYRDRIRLTREHLHPLAVEKARAKVSAAGQALAIATVELENSRIKAPSAGIVSHKALHVAGEYRNIRIGDQVYPNQPFLMIPDLENLEIQFFVPEAELSAVGSGMPTVSRLLAFPDRAIEGQVSGVGSVARTLPEKPRWQHYFSVRVRIDDPDSDIRPGMSVTTHVLSVHRRDILRVPRNMVVWEGDLPYVFRLDGKDPLKTMLTLGVSGGEYHEVIGGLAVGDRVLVR